MFLWSNLEIKYSYIQRCKKYFMVKETPKTVL